MIRHAPSIGLGLGLSLRGYGIGETSAFSAEALNYFSRLDTAGDTDYTPYKQPLANYIDGLVALGGGYWDNMESAASFVGVGILGIKVPLKDGMPDLTVNNFVDADLDQLTGLKGDGSTKYLGTNVNATTLDLDDSSISVRITADRDTGATAGYIGSVISNFGIINNTTGFRSRHFGSTLSTNGSSTSSDTLIGISRDNSADYDWRDGGTGGTNAVASISKVSGNIEVFSSGGGSFPTDARIATYHVGASLDLAVLEGLQDTLIAEIAAI